MSELQGHDVLRKHGQDRTGDVLVAVSAVPADHPPRGGTDALTRPEPGGGGAGANSVPARPVCTASEAWKMGWLMYKDRFVQTVAWGRVYAFHDGPRGRFMTRVGIAAAPIKGETIWHWALCSCPTGNEWGAVCTHKAAAFHRARADQSLPRGFPDF